MIKATFTESGQKLSLRVKGHAGYAEHGKDIVCASATILAYTLSHIVDWIDGVEPRTDMKSGDTTIECMCSDEEALKKAKEAYHFAEVGFALLQRQYPQYVRLHAFT